MADVEVSAVAFSKVVLHMARYPHCAVNGILLAENRKNKDRGPIIFVDSVPLFHLTLGLSPMLEVALNQVDAYCQENNLVIAGYYQANECIGDKGHDEIARKTVSRISDHCAEAYLFMINNENFDKYCCDENLFDVYQCKDTKINRLENSITLEVGSQEGLAVLLEESVHRDLVDFDNHLDDIALDWRNTEVQARIDKAS